jgi:hypothetical protein
MRTRLSDEEESLSSDMLAPGFLLSRHSNCASGLQSCSNAARLSRYDAFIQDQTLPMALLQLVVMQAHQSLSTHACP